MVNLGLAAGNGAGQAFSINDNSQIVGYETGSAAGAYLWGHEQPVRGILLSLVANLNGWTLQEAVAIDNQSDIVGLGTNASGVSSRVPPQCRCPATPTSTAWWTSTT